MSVMHELGHVATYEDQTCKDIRRKLKPFARKMEIQFGGEQLFMQTIHLLAFQSEVIANKWVAAASLEVLTKDLQEACIRWRNPSGVKLRYCLGQGLHILRTYLAMNLKHELANEYQLEDVKKILSQILAEVQQQELLRLIPEREMLWNLAYTLKVARYVSKSDKTIRRLSKQLPLN